METGSCAAAYAPLRKSPALFQSFLRPEWLAPDLLDVVKAAELGKVHSAVRTEANGVFSLDVFSPAFCKVFLAEVDHYLESGLPIRRPNSMNNYGLIVNEIGLRPALTELQQKVLWPISQALFDADVASQFHRHHSFVVAYARDKDAGLDVHTDDSDITANICLGDVFSGAGLTFCGTIGESDHRQFAIRYNHAVGRAVLHLGSRRHGADDISSGTRRNLIIWNVNDDFRQSAAYEQRMLHYAKESSKPDPRCLSYTHDRDYSHFKKLDRDMQQANARAWCPPRSAAYDGFGENRADEE
ncbi:putative 2OG-Fe(II) oxidoreductase like-protein [Pelagophyceae sp. CCMP2097]|nr:putative 2OG-Fe(II) oxidoreductase like-protein [Pelagophyceae sp. CCMP2097]